MLTKAEQELLLELLLKRFLKKNEQTIFTSIKFYEAISKLQKFGLVKAEQSKNNGSEKIYSLTYPDGWIRANMISQDKNNPEKYKELFKEFRIVP